MSILRSAKKVIKAFVPYGIIRLHDKKKENDQNHLERVFSRTLFGMNIGGGSDYNSSGEKWVIETIVAQRKAHDTLTVFDVGANQGHYSELWATIIGGGAFIPLNHQKTLFML